MIRTTLPFAALLVFMSVARAVDKPNQGQTAIEQKLLGEWVGGPGVGEIIFRPDGTFERRNYSPGNHTLKGEFELQWKALPPTLVLKCKESTNREFVDSVLSVSLVRLNDDEFAYQKAGENSLTHFDRRLRVRARVVYGSEPRKEKVADIEPWISKVVVKADNALALAQSDWITLTAEAKRIYTSPQGGVIIDGKVTEEKDEFKVEIDGCGGVPLRASAKMKRGERTVVNLKDGEFKTEMFVALEVIETK
jgi:hypothetical protein